MEEGKSALSVNAPLLACALALLREPMRHAGLCIEEGILLFVKDTNYAEFVQSELQKFGALKVRLRTNASIDVYNYKAVFCVYEKGGRAAAIESFMTRTDFLPVIVVKGIIPQELKGFKNKILVSSFDTRLQAERVRLFEEFFNYVTSKCDTLIEYIEQRKAACEKKRRAWFSDIALAIYTASDLLLDFACEKIGNGANDEALKKYLSTEVEVALSIFYRPDTELDLEEAICRSMATYLDRHHEVLVGDINQAEEAFWSACEAKNAIVFDRDFYYVADTIFHKATVDIQNFIPYIMLKQELYDRGDLSCNTESIDGYTVKRVFTKPNGERIRHRVLKLVRSRFDGLYHPDIAGRRLRACTSVSTMASK